MKSGWSVLSALVEDAADGHLDRGVLRELIDTLHDTRDPEALTLLAFARALARRDQALHDHANLYLRQLAVPQIELFQMLGAALPPVVDASRLVRDQLRFALEGAEAVTLVSIGCGTGQREAELLSGLGARRWHVFLVEPNADCLEQATRAVHDAADRAGASLALQPVWEVAEYLPPSFFEAVAMAPAPRAVMASFALHHMGDLEARDSRADLFHAFFEAGIDVVSIAEPSSDHRAACLRERFENARRHFGQAFRHIDAQPIGADHKARVKLMFFGRELEDILGRDEERVEQHEPVQRWVERVERAGFAPPPWLARFESSRTCRISPHALGFGDTDDPLIAVVAGVRA